MHATRIIDGDGHVFEDLTAIEKYMPDAYKKERPTPLPLFPSLDHMHGPLTRIPPDSFGGGRMIGPAEWREFMEDVGIEAAVLYPTTALSLGTIADTDWAVAVARAYNDWLYDTYLSKDSGLNGMGLIPMQEPDAAVEELRHVVTELGMCGAMIPSNGLKAHLGSKKYWPVYREAEELGCSLALHGGSHNGLGFDDFNLFAPVHALGHPSGMMISLAGMLFNGVFDRFPGLRFAFLEGGVAWFLFCLERFDASYEAFKPYDLRGELLQLPSGEKVSSYLRRQISAGRIFIGCEGDEPMLPYAVSVIGSESFLYSSDFPHEVTNESCKHEIKGILENDELADRDKEAILYANAERFYKKLGRVSG